MYGLTEKNKLKKVKSGVISASKGRGQLADVPLEKGTYYICVKAANWENHGDSTYTLTVSGEGFLAGDNRDDWTDLQTEGSEEAVPSFGTVTQKTENIITGEWVGLGDAVDYRKITLESAAKLSFLLSATDAIGHVSIWIHGVWTSVWRRRSGQHSSNRPSNWRPATC